MHGSWDPSSQGFGFRANGLMGCASITGGVWSRVLADVLTVVDGRCSVPRVLKLKHAFSGFHRVLVRSCRISLPNPPPSDLLNPPAWEPLGGLAASGFRGLGFRVRVLGFRVRVLGFRVRVLGFRVRVLGFGFRVLGFRV